MKKETNAHAAVLATNLFFAANFSFIKLISPAVILPFALNLVRVGVCIILFWVVWMFGKTAAGIQRRHWVRMIFCALCGVAINQMLFIKGLTMTSTIHASLLMLTTPLLITVFALWVLKERLTRVKAVGLLLGVAGAVMLVLGREAGKSGEDYLMGDILIFINAISYSIYFIIVRPLMEHYSPVHVSRWIFTLGFFMMLPFGANQLLHTDFAAFSAVNYLTLAAVVITGTFLAYFFNAYGIRVLGAGVAGAYIYTQPVFAVIISTFLLNESLSVQKFLAGCLIIAGVALVSRKDRTPIPLESE